MSALKSWSKTHKKWVDQFVIELRLNDVSGAQIGDELTTVFSHCQETGESPEEAFGSSKDYARSLGYQSIPKRGENLEIVMPMLLQAFLLFVFTYSMRAITAEHNFMLNGVVLGCWVGALAVILVMLLVLKPRVLMEKPWTLIIGSMVACGLGVAGAVASRQDLPLVINTPALPVAVSSGVLLLIATAWAVRTNLKNTETDDALVSPLDTKQEQEKAQKMGKWMMVIPALLIPVYVVIDTLFTFWMA